MISKIADVVSPFDLPLLINEDWRLLKETVLHGVHFDQIPKDLDLIEAEINRPVIYGLTCSNDLSIIGWAEQHNFDYISFCAVFPSPSVSSCELVQPKTLREARKMTTMPLFVSGGINLSNIDTLKPYNIQGIALISGILNVRDTAEVTKAYAQKLKKTVS